MIRHGVELELATQHSILGENAVLSETLPSCAIRPYTFRAVSPHLNSRSYLFCSLCLHTQLRELSTEQTVQRSACDPLWHRSGNVLLARFKAPCTNWPVCQNQEFPWTFPLPPCCLSPQPCRGFQPRYIGPSLIKNP